MKRLSMFSALAIAAALSLSPVTASAAPDLHTDEVASITLARADLGAELVSGAVLAQAPAGEQAAPAQPSIPFGSLLEEIIMAVIVAVVGVFWRRSGLTKERKELILVAADVAYGIVNEIARRTGTKIDDKVALGLAEVTKFLRAQGSSATLSESEEAIVRAVFDAKHGQEAKAASIAGQAAAAVARPQMPLAAT